MNKAGEVGIFVYGTLKKNQLRGSLWPRPPIALGPAITLGELWDLGSYPGLHLRRQIDVRGVDAQDRLGPIQKAFTYLMPQVAQKHRIRRIEPWKKLRWTSEDVQMDALVACWPDDGSFVPRDASEEDS